MPQVRTFVFALSPSPAQQERLRRWEGACRFLWNLAHEQRLAGLARPRDERVFPSAFGQARELTALRAEVDWLDDVPRHVAQTVLDRLGEAWKRCFARTGGQPRFRSKSHDPMSLEEFDPKVWRLEAAKGFLRFPKVGNLPITLHRPLPGKATTCELVRKVDQWFAHIACEVDDESLEPATGDPVAIDRGVAVAFADSTGALVPNPRLGAAMAPTIARLSRSLARKQRGSANRQKAKDKLAKAHRKLSRQRAHFLHTHSFRYAKNHRVIVLEDLQLTNMTASARGTLEEPGSNVRQKAGLNRLMLDVSMGRFEQLVTYKAARFGGVVVKVPAAYSSQECSACGHVDAGNRPTRERFACLACGHEDHADTNAAKVLFNRYTRRTGGEAVCGGDGSPRPAKQKPKAARSRTPSTKVRAQSPLLQGGDGLLSERDCLRE